MAAKRSSRRFSKARAIRNTLGRLGLHASAKDVAASLADYGIEVSEGLVKKVKVEMLKNVAGTRRQLASLRQAGQHPTVPLVRKTPAGRSSRK